MGCDGGTIPKRDELVRTKKKPEQKDKASDLAFKWRHCAISQETLVQPIMACELGRLYNKESVLEFLIDRSKFEFAARFEHLRGLKDLKELKLTDNPAAKSEQHAEKGGQGCYIDMQVSDYICPVSNFEMNGTHRFCFLWSCGCVMSGRALKEIKAKSCHKCGKAFTDNDKVILNGSEEETTENKYKMDYRRVQAKLAKKAKKAGKHSVPEETSSAEDGASSSKKSRVDPEPSTSGASNGSKLTNGTTTHKSKLAIGSSGDSKLTNGKLTNGRKGEAKVGKSSKTIQDDPKASTVYKGLFTTCERAKRQTQGPWVTFNPQYF